MNTRTLIIMGAIQFLDEEESVILNRIDNLYKKYEQFVLDTSLYSLDQREENKVSWVNGDLIKGPTVNANVNIFIDIEYGTIRLYSSKKKIKTSVYWRSDKIKTLIFPIVLWSTDFYNYDSDEELIDEE